MVHRRVTAAGCLTAEREISPEIAPGPGCGHYNRNKPCVKQILTTPTVLAFCDCQAFPSPRSGKIGISRCDRIEAASWLVLSDRATQRCPVAGE